MIMKITTIYHYSEVPLVKKFANDKPFSTLFYSKKDAKDRARLLEKAKGTDPQFLKFKRHSKAFPTKWVLVTTTATYTITKTTIHGEPKKP